MGHIISIQGVTVDPVKASTVVEWHVPKNVKGVHGFLGLTGYYRKFIKDYGKIATAPVLQLPNFDEEFSLECDACGTGIGAILMQNKKPVAYYNKVLSPCNLTKSAYERELTAVALAIQHWWPYLLG